MRRSSGVPKARWQSPPAEASTCVPVRFLGRDPRRLTWSSQVYTKPSIQAPFAAKAAPPLYLTHSIPHRPLTSVRFCPFQDILTVGHDAGLSSLLVPGSGEPNFDSSEADPFDDKKRRQEREVKGLLDKVSPILDAL